VESRELNQSLPSSTEKRSETVLLGCCYAWEMIIASLVFWLLNSAVQPSSAVNSAFTARHMLANSAASAGGSASWNSGVLGVPWAGDFDSIAANEINVRTDSRLKVKAAGDGVTDDIAAVRAAIHLASSSGGGLVYFPAGDYKIVASSGSPYGNPLIVPSRVVLRGDSPATSRIFVNDPSAASETDWTGSWGGIEFQKSNLSGMTDLGIYATNPSSSPCALLWNRGSGQESELFFNRLDVHLENCRSFWFEKSDKLLVQNSRFDSKSLQYGPIFVVGNSNVAFVNNEFTYHFGRVYLQDNTNLLMQGNSLVRDAENKDMEEKTAIESGGVELSFGQNLQIVNNTIQTLNAPPAESGDGEAIMTQNSNVPDVLDAGSVTAVASTTLTDSQALWGPVTASRLSHYHEVVAIYTGTAAGEWRNIQGIDVGTKTLTVDLPWDPVPNNGTLYSIFPWTLVHANIQGNDLIDDPNGIVIYDGCFDCTIQNNTLTNSRGIILRTVDRSLPASPSQENRRLHEMAIRNKILNNVVVNTSGVRPAFIALDTEAFDRNSYRGVGMVDIEVAGNVVKPYPADPNHIYQRNQISQEGIFPCFLFGPAAVKDPVNTVFQGVRFHNNSADHVSYTPGFAQLASASCATSSP
jgi:hypothetical protein